MQEIHIERASRRGLVSNLYQGRVSRVPPGMQAAFVDIGLERTAFLHAADIAGDSSARTGAGTATAAGDDLAADTVVDASFADPAAAQDIRRRRRSGGCPPRPVIKGP